MSFATANRSSRRSAAAARDYSADSRGRRAAGRRDNERYGEHRSERQGAEVIPFMTTRMIADSWVAADERAEQRRAQREAAQAKTSRRAKANGYSNSSKAAKSAKASSKAGLFNRGNRKGEERDFHAQREAVKAARAAKVDARTTKAVKAAVRADSRATKAERKTADKESRVQERRANKRGILSRLHLPALRLPRLRIPGLHLPKFHLPSLHLGRGLAVALLAPILCLGLSFAILYPVAKDYFEVHYAVAQLEAEFDAVSQRNDTIEKQIQWLQTDEGVEYRAREAYGWVKEGESVLNVTGADSTSTSTVLPTAVPTGSVQAESTWVDNLVKKVFGL